MNYPVINKFLSLWTVTLLLACVSSQLAAQGFLKTYPVNGGNNAYPARLIQTDSGYCITTVAYHTGPNPPMELVKIETDFEGEMLSLTTGEWDHTEFPYIGAVDCGEFLGSNYLFFAKYVGMRRFDIDGNFIWGDTIRLTANGSTPSETGSFIQASDGGWLSLSNKDFYVVKRTATGQQVFHTLPPLPIPGAHFINSHFLFATPDGGAVFAVVSYMDNTPSPPRVWSLMKVSGNGTVEVLKSPMFGENYGSQLTPDGSFYYVEDYGNTNGFLPAHLFRFSPTMDTLWDVNILAVIGKHMRIDVMFQTSDGGLLISGLAEKTPGTSDWISVMARFDANGNLLWRKFFNGFAFFDVTDILELPNGDFMMAGVLEPNIMLLKMDGNGVIYPNQIVGSLAYDDNENCLIDSTETPFRGWMVKATANGTDYFAPTDDDGNFSIEDLPGGPAYTIDVSVDPPAFMLEPCPIPQLTMPADSSEVTLEVDIPVQGTLLCPWMSAYIDVATLRQCEEATFRIDYINWGGGVAENAAIEVYLPEEIHFLHATHPQTQTGQTIRFELGDVPAVSVGVIYFTGLVSCDSSLLGQSLCVETHVFPDSICEDPSGQWSTASIELDGECLGDTVQLRLRNTGAAPTTEELKYLIIDDDVVMMEGKIPVGFPVGAEKIVRLAATGSTLRISSEQEPNHPAEGNPSIAVEGCNGWNLGFVTTFSNQTGDPFSDLVCRPVEESFYQNHMLAYPEGIDDEHFIEPETEIKYIILYQNTGDGQAETLSIRDTLPEWIDPASVVIGMSSHPYEWTMEGQGVMVFTFENIGLPDTNSNFNASKGHINFRARPYANAPLGTILENRAAIRFDDDPVIFTNTVFHTIDTGYLEKNIVSVSHPKPSDEAIRVFPNPPSDAVSIVLKNDFSGKKSVILTDAFGKTVQTKTFFGRQTQLRRGSLPAGVYFLKVIENERVVASEVVVLL